MSTESNAMARPSPAQEAAAALQAITVDAKAGNLSSVAELSEGTDEAHIAAHIRGMVAATVGHLSADAPAVTRHDAEQWQDWSMGVADGVAQTVATEFFDINEEDLSKGGKRTIYRISNRFQLTLPEQSELQPN